MFFRAKKSGGRAYLQIVESYRQDGQPRQRVIATLGRLDELAASGQIESLLASGARFAENVLVLSAFKEGALTAVTKQRIGPSFIFERLWEETGCKAVIGGLASRRNYGFSLERAVFLTVLHRLFCPGSDRAADKWRTDYRIDQVETLSLHHLYRTMAWLGEELSAEEQAGKTPFSPRCTKDLIEEALFDRRRDLFTSLDLVFFDTSSVYFEGEGGETLGQRGHSKDSRPDLNQMVVGVVLDGEGNPILSELWPGNTTDVKSLVPIVDRLRQRFGVVNVCIVADRGMIDQETIAALEEKQWFYILGARLRSTTEVRDEVLSRGGRYQVVHPKTGVAADQSPLKVKEVLIEERRYVVCLNEDQAKKDAADRAAILAGLKEKLTQGAKALVGNKGYRKYLASQSGGFVIDEAKVNNEARYDGKWVLRTNTTLPADVVALTYKQLWVVENIFRTMKSILETRPIYHKRDETIRGHVFCSFLALVLRKALNERLAAKGHLLEWVDIVRDLDGLEEIRVIQENKEFLLRSQVGSVGSKIFQAVGVALPPTVRAAATSEVTTT
jgi:Transposase DDE domain